MIIFSQLYEGAPSRREIADKESPFAIFSRIAGNIVSASNLIGAVIAFTPEEKPTVQRRGVDLCCWNSAHTMPSEAVGERACNQLVHMVPVQHGFWKTFSGDGTGRGAILSFQLLSLESFGKEWTIWTSGPTQS
jgi:hypothetical protein